MTTTNYKRINVTVTRYEGDVAFPEADHYDEYVAEQLAERYGAPVEVSFGLRTNVSLYGFEGQRDVEHEISTLVKVDLWDDFCSHGYKAFTKDAPVVAAAPAVAETPDVAPKAGLTMGVAR